MLHLGRVDPEGYHLSEAQNLLKRLKEVINSTDYRGAMIELLALEALVFEAQGSSNRGTTALEEALSLAEKEGYIRTFVDEGEPMRDLLRKADSSKISEEYVSKILEAFETQKVRQKPTSQLLVDPLTERELEVLKLLRTELTGPEIAQELSVSLNTIRTHTKSIYSKLDVNNRRAAVRVAQELSIL